MPIIKSNLDKNSSAFEQNAKYNHNLVSQLEETVAMIKEGNAKLIAQLHNQGKLPVRERILKLLDHQSEFLELSILAGLNLYDETIYAGGLVTGIGKIHQQDCMIIANDPTVKGGTYYPITVKKHLRAQEIAMQNQLPCIYLVDSGGANLPYQAQVFPDKNDFGRIFYNEAIMSAQGLAQIAVVMGSCTAGGAYIPAMADESIMVKENATIFLAGPPLVKAATGEIVTAQELGGANVHCKVSGVSDHYAQNDEHALMLARDCVKHLNIQQSTIPKRSVVKSPLYEVTELYGLIPTDLRQPMNMKEIIARIVDSSEFHEFKAMYGTSLICGFAKISGINVGIIANNGILFCESAQKGTHFIELCCQRNIPMVFFQNVMGFMVGKHVESKGIAKEGAKMVHAVACAKVPKLTVIMGGSYGAGNYAMAGRAYDPRFLWMWPNAKISVMGAEQAASVMLQVQQAKAKKNNKEFTQAQQKELLQQHIHELAPQSSAYYSSSRLWDDGVIDPIKTRDVLSQALQICFNAPIQKTQFGILRI